jgi:hypothetical protein
MVEWHPGGDWEVIVLLGLHDPNIVEANKEIGFVWVFSNPALVIHRARVIGVKVNPSREVWDLAVRCADYVWHTFEAIVRQHGNIGTSSL